MSRRRWFGWLIAAIIWLPAGCLVLANVDRWTLGTARLAAWAMWGCFALAVAFAVASVLVVVWNSAKKDLAERPAVRRWQKALLATLFVLGPSVHGILINLASSQIEDFTKEALPEAGQLYVNHDKTNLIGKLVRVMLLKARDDESDPISKARLADLAEWAPSEWVAMARSAAAPQNGQSEAQTKRSKEDRALLDGATEEHMVEFVLSPGRKGLDPERWGNILDRWSEKHRSARLVDPARKAVAQKLTDLFAVSIREGLKHSFARGGKAWAAMQLDIAQRQAAAATVDIKAVTEEWKMEMAGIHEGLSGLTDLVLLVRLQGAVNHKEVLDRFDEMKKALEPIVIEVRLVKDKVDQAYKLLERIDARLSKDPRDPGHVIELSAEDQATLDAAKPSADAFMKYRIAIAENRLVEAKALRPEAEKLIATRRSGEDFACAFADGDLAWKSEDYDGAVPHYRKALRLRPDDPATMQSLALSLVNARNSPDYKAAQDEALELLNDMVAALSVKVPGDDALVAKGLDSLGTVLQNRGDLAAAETRFADALEMRRRLYSGDHADVAVSFNNHGLVLMEIGELDRAEATLRVALDMRRRLRKGDDAAMATSLMNLSTVVRWLGRDTEAASLAFESLSVYRRLYPSDHPELAGSINTVGQGLQAIGRFEESEVCTRESLAMRQRLFTTVHPDTATSQNNLGVILVSRGRLTEAEVELRAALDMRRQLYAGDHPVKADNINNLAVALKRLDRPKDAVPLYQEALAMRERLFKGDHPSIAQSATNLAVLLKGTDEAIPLYLKALEMNRRLFPGGHTELAASMNNYALGLRAIGKHAEAEQPLRDALNMRQQLWPGGHPDIAISYNNLASLLEKLGKLEEAERCYRAAVKMRRELLGPRHSDVAVSLINLASLLNQSGHGDEAKPMAIEAGSIAQEALGANHSLTKSILEKRRIICGD